jgi:anti-sigma regulatory factor (Ser/Thr protein kinase)
MRTSLDVDIPLDARAPAKARRAVEGLGEVIDPGLQHDVLLLVSELVTNSVKYGGEGEVRLRLSSEHRRHVRMEIVDQGSGFVPVARTRPMTEPGGWGLHLVEELTDRWGVYEGSTHVWVELDR